MSCNLEFFSSNGRIKVRTFRDAGGVYTKVFDAKRIVLLFEVKHEKRGRYTAWYVAQKYHAELESAMRLVEEHDIVLLPVRR